MKAVIHQEYGAPETLTVREVAEPRIREQEVLVRVHAAALHVGDTFAVRGSPFLMRLFTGLRRPTYGVPGYDLAGVVTSVGSRVTRFRPGDEVFGSATGTCAEYVRAREGNLVAKPATLTFPEAAAIPTSALAALHGLRDAGKLKAGKRVLINGASGGVGTFAVQIAKSLGAHVTAVCSARNADLVRELGAHRVIDYGAQDFTTGDERYDVIFDNIENRTLEVCRRVLTPHGTLVLNSGRGTTLIKLLRPIVLSVFSAQKMRRFVSNPNAPDLAFLAALVSSGALRPVIGGTFSLQDTPAALRHIEGGHARGKVVIAV